jgi:hypothetical protein
MGAGASVDADHQGTCNPAQESARQSAGAELRFASILMRRPPPRSSSTGEIYATLISRWDKLMESNEVFAQSNLTKPGASPTVGTVVPRR